MDSVWAFLQDRLVRDVDYLHPLDPSFTSTWSEELFHDTHFDTPTLQLHAMRSGVRHRSRVNLTNPADRKSGRELMQIKRNDISANQLERGEIKFEIERQAHPNSAEDRHPMLGLVKGEHRDLFKKRLAEIGLDPQAMKPILTVRDVRRRVYILSDGKPFMSVSFDTASSGIWWAKTESCEIEPELNEIGFTEAKPEKRAYMETVLHQVVGEILTRFPEIKSDLSPKYNKAFDRLEAQIPFLRSVVRLGMQARGGMVNLALILALGLCAAAWVAWMEVKGLRSRSSRVAPVAVPSA
ncbi:MAG: hypothetical protein L0323_10550 [Planctomycetes bacterium]|nr:hypothetical protein [Planctomycetota bacterium]